VLILFIGDETLANIFPIQVLLAFELMAVWFVVLYQILVGLIPAFIYYHTGATLKTIRAEINSKKELLFAGVRSINTILIRMMTVIESCLKYGQNTT